MNYPLSSKLYDWLSKRFPDFRADPRTSDPTVKEKMNAFVILALAEPSREDAASIPDAAKLRRRNLNNTIKNTPIDDSELMDLCGSLQNALVLACELLESKDLVEKHLDQLWERRITELRNYFQTAKKNFPRASWENVLREHSQKIGISATHIEKAIVEILGVKLKPTPTEPRPLHQSGDPNVVRSTSIRFTEILNLTPAFLSVLFTVFVIAAQGGYINVQMPAFGGLSLKKDVKPQSGSSITPFGFSIKPDPSESKLSPEKLPPEIFRIYIRRALQGFLRITVIVIGSENNPARIEYLLPGRKAWKRAEGEWFEEKDFENNYSTRVEYPNTKAKSIVFEVFDEPGETGGAMKFRAVGEDGQNSQILEKDIPAR